MTRACVSMLLCSALLAPGAATAAVPERPPQPVSGAYAVHFNVNIASTLPAGAVIVCKARIAPNAQALPPDAAPVQTATGVGVLSGSSATCAVEIPFSWTVKNAQDGVIFNYEIQAVAASGSLPQLLRATAPLAVVAAYPSAGGVANLGVNVTF